MMKSGLYGTIFEPQEVYNFLVKSDEKNGWYIIKYDVKNLEVEIYNTAGFENDGSKYYSLTELQSVNL